MRLAPRARRRGQVVARCKPAGWYAAAKDCIEVQACDSDERLGCVTRTSDSDERLGRATPMRDSDERLRCVTRTSDSDA